MSSISRSSVAINHKMRWLLADLFLSLETNFILLQFDSTPELAAIIFLFDKKFRSSELRIHSVEMSPFSSVFLFFSHIDCMSADTRLQETQRWKNQSYNRRRFVWFVFLAALVLTLIAKDVFPKIWKHKSDQDTLSLNWANLFTFSATFSTQQAT